MSAILLQFKPAMVRSLICRRDLPAPLAFAAAIAGALVPWLLLVGAHGGLARSAAYCLAGPLPV
jgi:hypothetical protein